MELTSLGGGIMVALAAGLWLVYLMPTWFKRREFAVSERTEVRRQQALKVLQETAPVPAVVRAQAMVSSTGQVTDRDKLAEAIKRSRDAQAAREASRRFADAGGAPAASASVRARTTRRLRRTRAVISLLSFVALVTVITQIILMIATGAVLGSWAVLGFAAVVDVVSVSALARLATMTRRRAVVAAPAARPMRTRILEDREAARPPVASWTPVPLPKPMYLSRPEATVIEDAGSAAETHAALVASLRAAALESDRALREAQESPEVVPIPQPAASRFAGMGIVGAADVEPPDLDEVLRRRRQVG